MTTTDPNVIDFRARVEAHRFQRRHPWSILPMAMSAENLPPVGQAASWYWELVEAGAPRSGRLVARQLARLCGEGVEVVIKWRSLADAVGVGDRLRRNVAFTQRGVAVLVESGWLTVTTTGRGYTARTTFRLQVGNRTAWHLVDPLALEDEYDDDIEAA